MRPRFATRLPGLAFNGMTDLMSAAEERDATAR